MCMCINHHLVFQVQLAEVGKGVHYFYFLSLNAYIGHYSSKIYDNLSNLSYFVNLVDRFYNDLT